MCVYREHVCVCVCVYHPFEPVGYRTKSILSRVCQIYVNLLFLYVYMRRKTAWHELHRKNNDVFIKNHLQQKTTFSAFKMSNSN